MSSRAVAIVACLSIAFAPIAPVLGAGDTDARVDAAVASGLAFLARQQAPDGSFDGGGPRVAMTGLALLSFLSSGNTPDVGRYGLNVRRAIDYLLKVMPQDGYIGRVDGSRMYGQGIATLALTQAYGVEPDPAQRLRVRAAVERGVGVILAAQRVSKSQTHAGGWRYEPQSSDSDLSLSGWNVVALRAAAQIGIEVPRTSFEAAVAYTLRCARSPELGVGGFSYQPQGEVSVAMTGVGVVVLSLLDSPARDEAAAGIRRLVQGPLDDVSNRYPCYTTFYATHAALLAGEPTLGTIWSQMRNRLLAQQSRDGGWPASRSGEEPGRVYASSISLLVLSAPTGLLPAFQR